MLADCSGDEKCQQWTAKIQSIGYDGDTEGSGWTTVPEPLVGPGLAGLAGVGSFRRRENIVGE